MLQPHSVEVNKDLNKKRAGCDCEFSSSSVEFENHSDGQGVVEEQ